MNSASRAHPRVGTAERAARAVYGAAMRLGPLREVADLPLALRARRAARQCVLVNESTRFAAGALLDRNGVQHYHLRTSGSPVLLRHRTDSWTFEEIFRAGAYQPPSEVLASIDSLGRPPRIVDLGANIGLFSRWAADRWPGAEIDAVEPDPANARIFRSAFGRSAATVHLHEACAGTATGHARFIANASARSRSVLPGESVDDSVTLPTIDAFALIEAADLVKLDIEGAEWDLLADPRLGDPGQRAFVIEYHAHGCPGSDPAAEARTAMRAAGFRILDPPRPFTADEFPVGQGMLWSIRAAEK